MPQPDRKPSPEQLIRNWNELLQELRVMQTGIQILTGFLLTVPFSARFEDLAQYQRILYLGVLVAAVLTTCVIVAPVAFHRMLFRQRKREWLVRMANLCARLGLTGFAVVSASVMLLVFDVVVGQTPAWIAAASVALVFAALWFGVPRLGRRK
ncbi:DUF6328 family protein [Myceligenerans pegani]|uniref:Sodium:proton antiporter n=1 Tax=Myceligenerans pegani TaxID=2776917 RepID=A0ABR9N2T3_9MICO|nr:DUF6328 family protein [Myceligenerans sp. TRM 65318]MBE1877418.1 sodium:proton antiporter [Myceligenerans sp. TRM 65318]MBE3019689.1 sodium:proton antiporter [Myceligenerans sp. TRM 65318]